MTSQKPAQILNSHILLDRVVALEKKERKKMSSKEVDRKLEKIFSHIKANVNGHIAKIQEFLRQPSVSAENYGVRECATLLRDYFKDLGCREAKLVETKGHPVVYAEYNAHAEKTLIVYMMYDTQPVTGEKWTSPPLEARLIEIPPFGRCIVARGAINSKGPLRAFLNALESIQGAREEIPVNLKFTAEGEEELGSPHLPDFINQYVDKLKDADARFSPGASQDQKGRITMSLGYKGIVYLELECSGEHWGRGPTQFDVHSSNKAWVDSPVWRMIHALKTMTSEDGNEILIEGFYDNVIPPSQEDLKLVKKLEKTFDDGPRKDMLKVRTFIDDAHGKEAILKLLYSTTLNIDGIWGGYTGLGTKTVLPYKVTCKMDVRLVPNQHSSKIVPNIRAHLDKHGYKDVKIRQLSGYEWSKTSVREDIVQATIRAYKRFGHEPAEIWPFSAGSAPNYLYTRGPLYLPSCGGGLGHGGRAHSPDEYFVIDGNEKVAGLIGCEQSYVATLYEYAGFPKRRSR